MKKLILMRKENSKSDMREIVDSSESLPASGKMTVSLWDAEKLGKDMYTKLNAHNRRTRHKNMRKLQTYSKNIAQISLNTRTERK